MTPRTIATQLLASDAPCIGDVQATLDSDGGVMLSLDRAGVSVFLNLSAGQVTALFTFCAAKAPLREVA